jgi:WhiB family redox-sensing transcriptional regulator
MGAYDWQDKAACKGMDTDIFYKLGKQEVQAAIEICLHCPVMLECRAYAIRYEKEYPYRYGIFGGMRPEERTRGRKAARQNYHAEVREIPLETVEEWVLEYLP